MSTPEKPEEPAVARTKSPVRDVAEITLPRTMSEEWMAADVDDGAYEDDKRRPVWLIPGMAAAVITLAIVGVFAFSGSDSDDTAARPHTAAKQSEPPRPAPAPAPLVASAPPPAIDAPVPIDAAPIDAAQVASAPVDAAPEVHVDAAVHVAAAPPDAAVVAPKPEHVAKPSPPKPAKDERTIEELVAAGEFAKANTACADNTHFTTPRLEACATAACQTHSTALAQRWVRAIGRSAAAPILDKCKALGVELEAP